LQSAPRGRASSIDEVRLDTPAHAAAEVAAHALASLGERELGRPVTVRLVLAEAAAREAVEAALARQF